VRPLNAFPGKRLQKRAKLYAITNSISTNETLQPEVRKEISLHYVASISYLLVALKLCQYKIMSRQLQVVATAFSRGEQLARCYHLNKREKQGREFINLL
jgi:hypothetical protein